MPTIAFAISLSESCCCGCHGRVGDILEATVVDVEACSPEYSFTGVNGFYDDVTWDESTQDWRKLVGTWTGPEGTFDIYLIISCSVSEDNQCETWQVTIQVLEDGILLPRVYNASFFGPNCDPPNPDEFGTAIPNGQTVCFVSLGSGINGTVTLQIPEP